MAETEERLESSVSAGGRAGCRGASQIPLFPQSRGPVILCAHLDDSLDSMGWAVGGPPRCLHGTFLEMLDGIEHGLPEETEQQYE